MISTVKKAYYGSKFPSHNSTKSLSPIKNEASAVSKVPTVTEPIPFFKSIIQAYKT